MSAATPDFELTETLDADIRRAAERVREARHLLVLTGAGLSVESGIPPFRGKGGLWTKYGESLDGYQRFVADPAGAWRTLLNPTEPWMIALRETVAAAKPNPGHRALAELEALGHLRCLITQNIDDLHRQAGSRALAEIHGNATLYRCLGCCRRFARDELAIDPEDLPPRCPDCRGIVKADTVSFGEPIPEDVLSRCFAEVARCDCMLVAGTSATVYPAAGFPVEVARSGGVLLEVNPEPTELTPLASVSLQGPAGAILSRLLHWVRDASGEGAS